MIMSFCLVFHHVSMSSQSQINQCGCGSLHQKYTQLKIAGTEACKDCQKVDQCSCKFDDGSVVDITSLGNQDNSPRFKDVIAQSEGNHYSYNPCFAFKEGECSDAATCILSPDLSQSIQIGDASKVTFKYDSDLDVVVAGYSSGEPDNPKLSDILLQCDEKACNPSFTANGQQDGGEFRMTLTTVCACPNGCDAKGAKTCGSGSGAGSGSLTVGGIICIGFFSVLLLYFIIGAVFMKFVKKAEGKEIIPNVGFWVAIPVLSKDGVMFVLGKVFPRFRKTGYDSV